MRLYKLLFLAFLLSLGACQTKDEGPPTPATSFVALSRQPVAVSHSELASNPSTYENDYLQLTGQYSRLPRLFCDADPQPSPASWGITNDSYMALAGGFDSQLRSLLPEGMIITVAGRWKRWQGPVGCGNRATDQTIWYLEVDEILSPSPLAKVTLTPSGAAASPIAALPTAVQAGGTETVTATPAGNVPSATPPPGKPTEPPTATPPPPSVSPTATLTGSGIALTPQFTASPTPSIMASATATFVAGSSPTATPAGNPTTTATPTSASSPTATPTAGNIPPTNTPTRAPTQPPLPTATPSTNYLLVEKGSFDAEDLIAGFLDFNEMHSWRFIVGPSELITVSVAADPAVDVILSVTDAAGNQLWEQNQFPAGEIEQISQLSLSDAGEYQVRIRAVGGNPGSYVAMMLQRDSYRFVSQDILVYGDEVDRLLDAESDHFWYFFGNAGNSVTITVVPNDNGDLFLEVYDPDGINLGGFVDDGAGGEQETTSLVLPDTGMYSIRVGEFEFLPSSYKIMLNGS